MISRFVALPLAGALLVGTALAAPAYAEAINVAIVGEPSTLDPMMSTQDVVSIVTQHFVETLYTFDSAWNIAPLLATSLPEISEDGLLYRIELREGITFHDGTGMDSADAVASLNRWLDVSSRGGSIADKVVEIVATGDYSIEIRMNEPYSPLLSLLAFSNSAAVIYPEEIIADTIETVVGTGPYQLAEHLPDQYIQLTRFDDYVPRSEPADGGSGARAQVPDEINFLAVPIGSESRNGWLRVSWMSSVQAGAPEVGPGAGVDTTEVRTAAHQ